MASQGGSRNVPATPSLDFLSRDGPRRNPSRAVRQALEDAADEHTVREPNDEGAEEHHSEDEFHDTEGDPRPGAASTLSQAEPALDAAIVQLFKDAGMNTRDEQLGRTTDQLKDLAKELDADGDQPTVRQLISYESWRDYHKRKLSQRDALSNELTKSQALPKSIPSSLTPYNPRNGALPTEWLIKMSRTLRQHAFAPSQYTHALACLVPEADARLIRSKESFRAACSAFLHRYMDSHHLYASFEKVIEIVQHPTETVHSFNVRFNLVVYNLLVMFALNDNSLGASLAGDDDNEDVYDPLRIDDLLDNVAEGHLAKSDQNPVFSLFYMRALRHGLRARVARHLNLHHQDGLKRPTLKNIQRLAAANDDTPVANDQGRTRDRQRRQEAAGPHQSTKPNASSRPPRDRPTPAKDAKPRVDVKPAVVKRCTNHPHSTNHTTAECRGVTPSSRPQRSDNPPRLTNRKLVITEQADKDVALTQHWADIDASYDPVSDEGPSEPRVKTPLTHRMTFLRARPRTGHVASDTPRAFRRHRSGPDYTPGNRPDNPTVVVPDTPEEQSEPLPGELDCTCLHCDCNLPDNPAKVHGPRAVGLPDGALLDYYPEPGEDYDESLPDPFGADAYPFICYTTLRDTSEDDDSDCATLYPYAWRGPEPISENLRRWALGDINVPIAGELRRWALAGRKDPRDSEHAPLSPLRSSPPPDSPLIEATPPAPSEDMPALVDTTTPLSDTPVTMRHTVLDYVPTDDTPADLRVRPSRDELLRKLQSPDNVDVDPPAPVGLDVGISAGPDDPILDLRLFVDTGMNTGALYKRAVPQLERLGAKVTYFVEPERVEVHAGVAETHIGFCSPVLVTYAGTTLAWEFPILEDDGGEVLPFDGVAGRLLMDRFGVHVANLAPSPASAIPTTVDHDDDSVTNLTVPHPERQRVLDGIAVAYAENGKVTGLCNLRSAQVNIRPTKRPRYIRQYPIPVSHQKFLAEKADELLKEGTIELARHDSPFNLPLTCARKKDPETGLKTKLRLCIDPRELNALLPEEDSAEA